MRKPTNLLLGLGLCSILGAAGWSAEEHEVSVKESEVPAKALAALKTAANGAALSDFEKEKQKGKEVYTAKFKDKDGKLKEAAVTPDGTLVGVEAEGAEAGEKDEKDEKDEKGKK